MPNASCRQLSCRGLTTILLVLCCAGVGSAQPYGVDAPVPIGAFLDGTLPSTTPGPTWDVADAFDVAVQDALVIVANPADDRLYVGSRDGLIVSHENMPAASTTVPFMDLRDRVAVVADGGLLGMVFHPDFGQPGSPHEFTFYIYTATYCPADATHQDIDMGACNPGYPQGATLGFFGTWLRLSRFEAYYDPVDQAYKGDSASEEPMLSIRLYNTTHRGGGLVFGTDGLMYLTIGDQQRYWSAQEIVDTLEGGTMRLAVDITDNGDGTWICPAGSHMPRRIFQDHSPNPEEMSGRLYCIPDDNPWLDAGGAVYEEYFTVGHRNPHRLALDPVENRLWSGEVGEVSREEINVIEKGRNYGWPYREGKASGPWPMPDPPLLLGVLTDPVIDFTRAEANAIIGGYVYRGTRFPQLVGRYLAGDFVTGNIWAFDLDPLTMTATKEFLTTFDPGGLGTWGQDKQGEVYMGSVISTIPLQTLEYAGPPVPDPPALLSQIGAFDDVASFDVHDAAIPFEPLTFWSDRARKTRWIFLPNDGTHDQPDEQITFSESGNWDFPVGTVLMKHFDLPLDLEDPLVTTRLETRFLAKGTNGEWYGLTYRWQPDQLDAQLLTTSETADYTVQLGGGQSMVQTWYFPERRECLVCHNSAPGGPVGPRTHQLNRDLYYPATGVTDNQLRAWNHIGIFSPPLVEGQIPTYLAAKDAKDASASLELRGRSYLDTNCSYCHQPGTGNRATFDARLTTPLDSQGLIWGAPFNTLGVPGAHYLTPGDPLSSVVYLRASAVGVPEAMPPLAKGLLDAQGVGLLYDWILRVRPQTPRSGLVYEYYEFPNNPTTMPDFDTMTPLVTSNVPSFDISVADRDLQFGIRFEGYVDVPVDGDWTFYTASRDGSQLHVDDVLIVDNDGVRPTIEEASGIVNLTAGLHAIRVDFFTSASNASLSVSWEGPGTVKQLISPSVLFQEIPAPYVNVPPTLVNPGDQADPIGQVVVLALVGGDGDGDLLYYTAQGLPPGLAVDPDSGEISGVIAQSAAGLHAVTLSASDGPNLTMVGFDWTVDGLPDTVDPTVSLTAPAAGTLAGQVTVQASASDARGVAGVQFLLDGAPLGAEDVASPFELVWDTRTVANGSYVLSARARDGSGNTALAPDVAVDVDNVPDTTDPLVSITAPAAGSISSVVTVQANASDDVGVVGVQFLLDGAPLGAEVVSPPFERSWNTLFELDGPHVLSASARDAAGNVGLAADVAVTIDNSALRPVAAWAFDEGGGGNAADASGNGHDGTIMGALWAEGQFGGALEFDGADDAVLVPDHDDLDLGGAMTLSAWVYPTTTHSNWAPIVQKEADAYFLDGGSEFGGVGVAGITTTGPCCVVAQAPSALPVITWSHIAASYDGSFLRYFINGVEVASEPASGPLETTSAPLWIGNNSYPGEAWTGRIDEVRVYDRALSAAEIQTDMANPIQPQTPDTTDPTVSLTAPPAGTVSGTVQVTATASDDRGVEGVQFLLDGVPLGTEDTVAPYAVSWDTWSVANGSYSLSALARDAAGNFGLAATVAVDVANVVDTTAPLVSLTAPLPGAVSGTVALQADASDDVGVVGVQFLLDGQPLGPEDLTPPYGFDWITLAGGNGPRTLSAEARDASGNVGVAAAVAVSVSNLPPAPVAAWDFEEPSGSTAFDVTGNGHDGTVAGPQRTADGYIGRGLTFDGVNDEVLVPDANGLDLASGAMTITARVRPSQALAGWTAVVHKEPDAYFLHADSFVGGAAGGGTLGGICCAVVVASQTPQVDVWTHLAVTYDGSQLIYYVDGIVAGTEPASGGFQNSPDPLRIGNNSYSGEGFAGGIDEVRIYDQALHPYWVQADMMRAVPEPDQLLLLLPGIGLLARLARRRRLQRC